jgi:hypothetical protein
VLSFGVRSSHNITAKPPDSTTQHWGITTKRDQNIKEHMSSITQNRESITQERHLHSVEAPSHSTVAASHSMLSQVLTGKVAVVIKRTIIRQAPFSQINIPLL